jgi:CelD/BcsL family acetyltransferase involved in cellulose biosynthesis
MGRLRVEQIDSAAGFRAVAAAWDDLWQRSEVTLPTARAELVAQWLETFAPRAKVRGFLVWDEQRLLAALALVGRRAKGVLPVGDLASNYWSASGELLLDPAADGDAVLDLMAGAVQDSPWPLLWLDLVPLETLRWEALARAFRRRGMCVVPHVRYQIGQVELGGDFAAFEAKLSENLRRSLRKDLRRLERVAPVELELISDFTPEDVGARLREVFEIEARSWKNQPGQAVLKTPRMFDFYLRLGGQLAAWGCLRVALLKQGGRPIAGELGWVAKGVYHSFKVAYDQEFREFGPGHLLRRFLVEELFRRQGVRAIDFQGPMTEALASWSTRSYPIGRLVIAPNRPASRLLLAGYWAGASLVRRASS